MAGRAENKEILIGGEVEEHKGRIRIFSRAGFGLLPSIPVIVIRTVKIDLRIHQVYLCVTLYRARQKGFF